MVIIIYFSFLIFVVWWLYLFKCLKLVIFIVFFVFVLLICIDWSGSLNLFGNLQVIYFWFVLVLLLMEFIILVLINPFVLHLRECKIRELSFLISVSTELLLINLLLDLIGVNKAVLLQLCNLLVLICFSLLLFIGLSLFLNLGYLLLDHCELFCSIWWSNWWSTDTSPPFLLNHIFDLE